MIIKEILEFNKYSRSGQYLNKVNNIVVHYVANPNSTAMNNRDYFNTLKNRYASSHYIVGFCSEVVQCIPLDEIAYGNYPRNNDTISIEFCHKDTTGEPTYITQILLTELLATLCIKYGLKNTDVIRHYDVNKKICPKWYVNNPDEWEKLLGRVQQQIVYLQHLLVFDKTISIDTILNSSNKKHEVELSYAKHIHKLLT